LRVRAARVFISHLGPTYRINRALIVSGDRAMTLSIVGMGFAAVGPVAAGYGAVG